LPKILHLEKDNSSNLLNKIYSFKIADILNSIKLSQNDVLLID